MQLSPNFLTGFPHYTPEAAARESQGHDEQSWPAVPLRAGNKRESALAIINLYFFRRTKFEPVMLLGIVLDHRGGETFDAAIAGAEAELIDQVLINRSVVASQVKLSLNKCPMRLAFRYRTRWSGWGNFNDRAGGRHGGI